MKKVLITLYYMECGGVENAVIDLMKQIPTDQYEVTLLLLEKRGAFLDRVPKNIRVEEFSISPVKKFLIQEQAIKATVKFGLQNKKFVETVWLALKYFFYRKKHDTAPAYRAAVGKKTFYNCDIALDFHGYNSFTTYFVSENVAAKKKYTWVHSELIAAKLTDYEQYLRNYKAIFCVSEKCAEIARNALPDNEKKRIHVFHNLIDTDRVLALAKAGNRLPSSNAAISILTVGRLSYPKGYDIALQVAKRLKDQNCSFKWYFCGDGEEKENIIRSIQELNLEEYIVMLGYQDNPYGFMDSCDIYVQSSRYEGYAVTVVEASTIGCPIISTDVSGAREEIVDGKNGFVVPMDVDAIMNAILVLMQDKELRYSMRQNRKHVSAINLQSAELLKQVLS